MLTPVFDGYVLQGKNDRARKTKIITYKLQHFQDTKMHFEVAVAEPEILIRRQKRCLNLQLVGTIFEMHLPLH